MSRKMRKSVEPVRTRLGTIYGICKVHKQYFGQFYRLDRLLHVPLLSF